MKQRLIYTLIILFAACHANSQTTVTGTVTDGREPLTGANVYITGTIDGCLTDSLGRFSFQTDMVLNPLSTHVGCDKTCTGFSDSWLGQLFMTVKSVPHHAGTCPPATKEPHAPEDHFRAGG